MPSKNLVNILRTQYPNITFSSSDIFKWSPDKKTIYYDINDEHVDITLLHELAHALLDHRDFALDVELIRKEADAWHHTETVLAGRYNVSIPETHISESMESYRYWLHQRSKCPDCAAQGLQTKNTHYTCLVCGCDWRANDARVCGLKRYKLTV